jgi:hypothetical protein
MSVVVADAMSDPLASLRKEERTREVPVAAPRVGETRVGEPEKTKFVEVVPVVPVAALR